MASKTAEQQLATFIARFTPEVQDLANAALAKMRRRLPDAVQIVYDNYNALAIGFGPTERSSSAVLSIVLYPRWVTLFFLNGVGLPDPEKRLCGNGKQVRHIVLRDPELLDSAPLRALMAAALKRSKIPMTRGAATLVIKSISAKQRPRRPPSAKAKAAR